MQTTKNQVFNKITSISNGCVLGGLRLWAGCVSHNQTQPGCVRTQPHNRKHNQTQPRLGLIISGLSPVVFGCGRLCGF